jgi:UDP-N-acetylglucosamine acyltransferase
MLQIHTSAVVDPSARIADDAAVGPFCHVGANVLIGGGTRLVSHVAVLDGTVLGDGNTIWPHVTLGANPQDLKYKGEHTDLLIGDRNDIRESVTIHLGTANGGGVTQIGNDNLIMVGAHIAHDCTLGNSIVLANHVQLAGHVVIGDHAVIGGASAVQSYVSIGQFAFVGGMTRVTKDVPPFMKVEGNPAVVRGVNTLGLERNQFSDADISRLKEAFRRLFRSGSEDEFPGNLVENIASLSADYGDEDCIQSLVESLRQSMGGVHGRHLEARRRDNRHTNPAR